MSHLTEIGGELRQLERALRDIVMRLDHVTPRWKPGSVQPDRQSLLCCSLKLLLILLEPDPPQVPAKFLNRICLRYRSDGSQQVLTIRQDPLGLLISELPPMRPLLPRIPHR